MTEEEKLEIFRNELKDYKKEIFKFQDFNFADSNPKEPGYYLTIRCGLNGIYQIIDEFKDEKWQTEILDGSFVVAYSRETVEIKALKLWEDKNKNKNKCGQQ